MASKIKVLFICQHNSGRSQIAEAYLREIYGEHFEIESAGLEPAEVINPLVVAVMQEVGLDLSKKKPQSIFELFKQGKVYGHVVTVCHDSESKCPLFPRHHQALALAVSRSCGCQGHPCRKSLPRFATFGMPSRHGCSTHRKIQSTSSG